MSIISGLTCSRLTGSPAYASTTALPPSWQGLATDLPGWALIGQDLHLLDDKRNFVNYRMVHSFPTSMAWSHQ
jgi:hypothetical protein